MIDKVRAVKVRNLTANPRGVPDSRGRYVYLLPGQTSRLIDFRDVTLRKHQRLGILEVIGEEIADPKIKVVHDEIKAKESLADQAKRLGIDVDGRWGEARLKREIAKAEAAKAS